MNIERGSDYAALLKRSAQAIDQLQAKLTALESASHEAIAIVGVGCRFPMGANTPASFWELLRNGVDAVTEVPLERWDANAYFDPDPDKPGKSYTKWGAFIRDVDRFDADFFNISPREATSMDPQQRLLLEVTWQALEHAAIAPASLAGSKTAVYIGITTVDYWLELAEAVGSRFGDAYTSSGTAHSVAGGRISYALGLHGPNLAIDTACSSSLVALHLALVSLRQRESDVAIAGGVNLTLGPSGSVLTSRARMMSFAGRCKTFDASADGYVRGEGGGLIVLKRLSDAQRDGDRILGLVRGSAVNHDGRSSGLTAPNSLAQEAVIRAALADARLQPNDINYVEAHGTGTPLGDPIEIKALNQVYGQRDASTPLPVGSVKTNIGHLEAAAGIAGVIKTVLAMQHGVIPPHLHLKNPSPLIDWSGGAITVASDITPWLPPAGGKRRAGVSSFGFSGTNAHVILEEAPAPREVGRSRDDALPIVISAQTPRALAELAANLRAHLATGETDLGSLASTLALGRSQLVERAAFVATDIDEACTRLEEVERTPDNRPAGVAHGRVVSSAPPEVVFMFTGQGAQYSGMARGLYESEPVFRAALDECAAGLAGELPRPLLDVMFGETGDEADALDDTAFTQPALFSVSYALVRLWAHWGVEPTAVLGHSVGEYVAACVAGVFTLPDALRLIAARGRLMSRLPREGGMAAVMTDENTVRAALAGHEADVSLAASNGPNNLVIAGRHSALDAVLLGLAERGVQVQRLKVSHAFHSPLMEPILDEFERLVADTPMQPPTIGVVSNVTGEMADASMCTAAYWRRHVREAVRFGDSIATLRREGYRIFVELGPAPTLAGMAQRIGPGTDAVFFASLRKGRHDRRTMLDAAMQLHVRGQRLAWTALLGDDAAARRTVLPGYPFQRESYWHNFGERTSAAERVHVRREGEHSLLGSALPSAVPIFENRIALTRDTWLRDHRIFDFTLFPATGFLELAHAAGQRALHVDAVEVGSLTIREALALPDEGDVQLQVAVMPFGGGSHLVHVHSRTTSEATDGEPDASSWKHHASCEVRALATAAAVPQPLPIAETRERLADEVSVGAYYEQLERYGAHYGTSFRGIQEIRCHGSEVLGRVELSEAPAERASEFGLHPALLDACIQLVGAATEDNSLRVPVSGNAPQAGNDFCVPVSIGTYRVHRSGAATAWCHASVTRPEGDPDSYRADLVLTDDQGVCIAELRGLEVRRTSRAALQRLLGAKPVARDWLFETSWVPQPLSDERRSENVPAGAWLLQGDSRGVTGAVAQLLRARGASPVITLDAGTRSSFEGDAWQTDVADPAAWRHALIEGRQRGGGRLAGVVLAGAIGVPISPSEGEPAAVIDDIEHAEMASLSVVLAASKALADFDTRAWVLTRGAQAAGDSAPDLVQAPLWALAGVMAAELAAHKVVRIDLDDSAPDTATEATAIVDHLTQADEEDRVALRGGQRLVARLAPSTLDPRLPESPLLLETSERGALSNLRLVPVERETPGPGQLEIRVLATGLNFRDVLNALGMYPGDPGPLGNECAGIVTAVGEGVTGFSVGDEVVAMATNGCFATWTITSAAMTVKKPREIEFTAAATVPVTFLTAQYAFRDLSGIKRGDRVLIHAITGGVGMAALQLALRAGAIVYGTAGTPAKRALARRLGAHYVSDSRSLSFVEEFKLAGIGEGMDIVLNSLAGEFIPQSLALLRPGGHFVEIGKTGIWDSARVSEAFPGRHYHALYLGEVAATEPALLQSMLAELFADMCRGELHPLPLRCWSLDEAESAFRFMAQGHHTGKIVITQSPAPAIRPDASYLITGGFGGLGLACAAGLADAGARHLILASRSAPTAAALQAIDSLRSSGVAVSAISVDVTDLVALSKALAGVLREGGPVPAGGDEPPPLRGILHAAGLVDDAMLAELDLARFKRVMAPKVRGTLNLQAVTAKTSLDFFVTFSSAASILGSAGQGNYAAANAFMDALAHRRRRAGRHALSINWGSWAGAGMAASVDDAHRRRWAAQGLTLIQPGVGVDMFMQMLRANRHAVAAAIPLRRASLPANVPPFLALLRPGTAKSADGSTDASSETSTIDLRQQLRVADQAQRRELLGDFLADQIVRVLALGKGRRIDQQRSLLDLGMDSLMVMELRNRVQAATGLRLAVADLLQGPSIQTLAADLAGGVSEELVGASVGELSDAAGGATAAESAWEEGTL